MIRKSDAYYRYCQEAASGKFSYYDTQEIEDIANDFLDNGELEDALDVLKLGLEQHPGDEFLEKCFIWALIHDHQVEKALLLFEKYKDDNSSMTARLQFSFDILNGNPDKAFDQFLKALDGQMEMEEWLSVVDEMFDAIPKNIIAENLKKAFALANKHNAKDLGRLGSLIMDAGDTQTAAKVFERALDADAYDVYTWIDLTKCYFDLGNFKKCFEASELGLAVDPENPILNLLYVLSAKEKEFDEKMHYEMIEHLTYTRRYIEGRLKSRFNLGSDAEARHFADMTYELLATHYLALGLENEVQECISIVAKRTPADHSMFNEIISFFLDRGDLNKTLETIEIALRFVPNDTNLHTMKVTTLLAAKRWDEAYLELKYCSHLFPDDNSMLFTRAEMAKLTGHEDDADFCYRELLARKPQNEMIRDLLRFYFRSIGDEDALNQLQ